MTIYTCQYLCFYLFYNVRYQIRIIFALDVNIVEYRLEEFNQNYVMHLVLSRNLKKIG